MKRTLPIKIAPERLTPERVEKIKEILRGEVEIYDQYLRGEVYGFIVEDDDGEHIDSCWGFYGDTDYPLKEARGVIDHHLSREEVAA